MSQQTLYLKLERDIEIPGNDIYMKDVAKVLCKENPVASKAKSLKIASFDKNEKRKIIGVLKIIEILEANIAGINIQPMGETDVLVEKVKAAKKKNFIVYLKIIFVAAVCFFGSAFTIMAFHTDIGINDLFKQFEELVTGNNKLGYGALEVSYSIGLAVGITVFFNHIGKRRITKDPTPVEVAMRTYENDVNTALVETANREGRVYDVD